MLHTTHLATFAACNLLFRSVALSDFFMTNRSICHHSVSAFSGKVGSVVTSKCLRRDPVNFVQYFNSPRVWLQLGFLFCLLGTPYSRSSPSLH